MLNRTDVGVPLALLPSGNSNLLAGYFRIKKDPKVLAQTIAEGVAAQVDAGEANRRLFLLMASCGFDAEVVRRVHGRRTGHVSNWSYLRPIAEAIWHYDFPEIRIQCPDDDPSAVALVRWAFVFNIPRYGGGFRIAPQADGADGLLDLCTLRRGHFLHGLGYVTAILAGLHRRLPGCTTRRLERLTLTSDTPMPYQLDGDPGGMLPLEIQVRPGRLKLLVPREAISGQSR